MLRMTSFVAIVFRIPNPITWHVTKEFISLYNLQLMHRFNAET